MEVGAAKDHYRTLLDSLTETLRPHGFRRHGGNYRREFPHLAQAIGVQRSDSSTATHMRFTLNVGVWSRDVDLARGREGRAPGSILHCHAVQRIGGYAAHGQDVWWDVRDDDDMTLVLWALEPLLLRGAVLHLDRLITAEALLAEWANGSGLHPYFHRERFTSLLRQAISIRGGIDDVLSALAENPDCAFDSPAGPPSVVPSALPRDVVAFFEWCGGADLFGGVSLYGPDLFEPLVGLLGVDPDRSVARADWFVFGSDGGDTTLLINLSAEKAGHCAAAPFESLDAPDELPVVASSLTEFLRRVLAVGGDGRFWSQPGFGSENDAGN